jgi:amino acid transporter
MILSSAAASTQTTILPTARTTLSMAVYQSIPKKFGYIHRRFLTPTFSTVAMGLVSIVLYVIMNFLSKGAVIGDAVSALGVWIAFYYGLTGFACVWYYRASLRGSTRNLFMRGIFPAFGGIVLWFILGWSFWYYWSATRSGSYTSWTLPFPPHQQVSGVFVIDVITALLGVVLMFVYKAINPAFFRGETLSRDSATLVTEDFLATQAAAQPPENL